MGKLDQITYLNDNEVILPLLIITSQLQAYCSHRISPHRGEFATFAKTVAIRGDFMLKCGKWRILLDKR